jgi:hypothetical protein
MVRILGSTGSRRRRRYQLAALFSVVGLLALIAVPASAVLPGSPSAFESGNDPTLGLGNMIVDNLPVPPTTVGGVLATAAPHTDWVSVTGLSAYVHLADAAAVTTDDSFTPGQKQDTTCPTIEGHKNPPKDDFTDVASFNETASNGDVYLYGATIRFAANGNASENIELKQGTSGLCPGSTTLLARTAGDKLLAIDYLGGGKAVQFHLLEWVTGGACNVGSDLPPCWGATVLTLDPTVAEGGVNTTAIPGDAANNPINGKALVAGQFAEFGVNLSAAGILPNTGACSGFAQTVWESRSSGSSFVSSTKDITIEDHNINPCASVSVLKLGSDGGSQAGAVFTLYNGSNTSGTVVGTCTVDATGACLPSFSGLSAGTYTIDETTTVAGYGKDPILPFTFTLVAGQTKALTFTDPALNGAIKVTKTYKHAASGAGNHPQSGVVFTVNGVTKTTDANGEACFDGLPQATYTVHETVPAGYHVDANDQQVTVNNAAKCSDATYVGETVSFHNTPLTDLTITATSEVTGGTTSTITCTDGDHTTFPGTGIGNSPQGGGTATVTANALEPGTYTCEVVIDP